MSINIVKFIRVTDSKNGHKKYVMQVVAGADVIPQDAKFLTEVYLNKVNGIRYDKHGELDEKVQYQVEVKVTGETHYLTSDGTTATFPKYSYSITAVKDIEGVDSPFDVHKYVRQFAEFHGEPAAYVKPEKEGESRVLAAVAAAVSANEEPYADRKMLF